MNYLNGSYLQSEEVFAPISIASHQDRRARLFVGKAAALISWFARHFWRDIMDGLAVHGACAAGFPLVEIQPTNWRDADIAALLDTGPVERRS